MRSHPTQQQQAIYRQYLKRVFYGNTQYVYVIPHANSAEVFSGFGITKAQKKASVYKRIDGIYGLAVMLLGQYNH